MRRVLWFVCLTDAGHAAWRLPAHCRSPASGNPQSRAWHWPQHPARPVWATRSSRTWATAGMMSSTTRSTFDVDMPTNTISATTTISAQADQALSAFNLDLHGLTVDTVTVNGAPAAFSTVGDELTITPTAALPAAPGSPRRVAYLAFPARCSDPATEFTELGWQRHGRRGLCDERASRRHELAPSEQSSGGQGVLYPPSDGGQTLCRCGQRRPDRDDRQRRHPHLCLGDGAAHGALSGHAGHRRLHDGGTGGARWRAIALLFPAGQGCTVDQGVQRSAGDDGHSMPTCWVRIPLRPMARWLCLARLGYAMENQTLNLFGLDSTVGVHHCPRADARVVRQQPVAGHLAGHLAQRGLCLLLPLLLAGARVTASKWTRS